VSATAETPDLARRIADTAADFLAEYAVVLEKKGSGNSGVTVQKAVPGSLPTAPSTPSPLVLGALGLMAGAASGICLVLLLRARTLLRAAPARTPARRSSRHGSSRRRPTAGAPTAAQDTPVPASHPYAAPDVLPASRGG
jgi:hypothetical protein